MDYTNIRQSIGQTYVPATGRELLHNHVDLLVLVKDERCDCGYQAVLRQKYDGRDYYGDHGQVVNR